MTDSYMGLANGHWTSRLFKLLNLPRPTQLQRYSTDEDTPMHLLIGCAKNTGLISHILPALSPHLVSYPSETAVFPELNSLFNQTQLNASPISLHKNTVKFEGIIFDATGISNTSDLKFLYDFFNPIIKQLSKCGRIIIIARERYDITDISCSAAQRSIEGFYRSLAKEIGRSGSTCQLLHVKDQAESQLVAPINFFLSKKSAYISGQSLTVSTADTNLPAVDLPLHGKTALVTGASRGIGKSIAETLSRDGAKVICLDIPQQKNDLEHVAQTIKGESICLDITSKDTPHIISALFSGPEQKENGIDIIVHNAGVTMDKTLAKMTDFQWDKLMHINLTAIENINAQLLNDEAINQQGRIICVSSMSGIAGNFGQTNYATSKAAIIGYVQTMPETLAKKQITINAVAPGFIETQMTESMPFISREAGRRMNSLQQGGLPIDVAEAITFFAAPLSAGITGNVLRVCGQSLIGA